MTTIFFIKQFIHMCYLMIKDFIKKENNGPIMKTLIVGERGNEGFCITKNINIDPTAFQFGNIRLGNFPGFPPNFSFQIINHLSCFYEEEKVNPITKFSFTKFKKTQRKNKSDLKQYVRYLQKKEVLLAPRFKPNNLHRFLHEQTRDKPDFYSPIFIGYFKEYFNKDDSGDNVNLFVYQFDKALKTNLKFCEDIKEHCNEIIAIANKEMNEQTKDENTMVINIMRGQLRHHIEQRKNECEKFLKIIDTNLLNLKLQKELPEKQLKKKVVKI